MLTQTLHVVKQACDIQQHTAKRYDTLSLSLSINRSPTICVYTLGYMGSLSYPIVLFIAPQYFEVFATVVSAVLRCDFW